MDIGPGGEDKTKIKLGFDGIKVSILFILDKNTYPHIPENSQFKCLMMDDSELTERLKIEKAECDFLIVYVHWGEQELTRLPSPSSVITGPAIKYPDSS